MDSSGLKLSSLSIRLELEKDYHAVEDLTRRAFWNVYTLGCDEHYFLSQLRNDADFLPSLSCMAEIDGTVVGYIACSKSKIISGDGSTSTEIVTFGPLCVHPGHQKRGIGKRLVMHTARLAKEIGFPAIAIYGDPRYYTKYGFFHWSSIYPMRLGFRCGEFYSVMTNDGYYAVSLLVLPLSECPSGKFLESPIFESIAFDCF
jgi:predicted N-acetyltransferase YhbS